MANLGSTFDVSSIKRLEDGWYVGAVTSSEIKATQSGDGAYILLYISVAQGPFAGETVSDLINYRNPNQTAENIAAKQLAKYCNAVGVAQLQDTEELHNKLFEFRGAWVPSKNPEYADQFRVKDVRPYLQPGAQQAQAQMQQPPQQPAQQPLPPQGQPWQQPPQPQQWAPPPQPQQQPPQQQQQWAPPQQQFQPQQQPPQPQQQAVPPAANKPPWEH